MKGYLTVVEAKLLQPVNETFCSVPTNGGNYHYLYRLTSCASTDNVNRQKGPTASPMIESAKDGEEGAESSCSWNCFPSHRGNPPDL